MPRKTIKEGDINIYREGIDGVDKKIVELLAERFRWTQKVGEYKAAFNLPAKNLKREQEVFKDRRLWAKKFEPNGDSHDCLEKNVV